MRPLAASGQRGLRLLAGVGAIGKDMAQPREEIADRSQQVGRPVSILDVGAVYLRANQMTVGIGNDVALAGVARVPQRVFQRLLPERATPERCVEGYYLQRTRLESIAARKLRGRQLTENGNVEDKRARLALMPEQTMPPAARIWRNLIIRNLRAKSYQPGAMREQLVALTDEGGDQTMQRRHLTLGIFLVAIWWASIVHAGPSIYPTGVTRYDPGKAYNAFVLFSGSDDKTHLIDMEGNEVHRWDHRGFPSGMLDPALVGGVRGHVMVQLADMTGSETGMIPGIPAIFKNKTIGEVDWDGNIVWQWGETAPGGAAQQHHDWARLPNGDTLVLSVLSYQIPGFALPKQLDDAIYEVTPNGEIVWKWIAGDHLDEFGFSPEALALVRQSDIPDYLHVNSMKPLGRNHWFRDGDARFDPDNIVISSREANLTIIIEKTTGHVVWRLGPTYPPTPKGPRRLPSIIDQISGQHDPHLIPEGLAGAGNLLMFDNQGEAGFPSARLKVFPGSRALEIDPVKQQIVWEYTGSDSDAPEWTFYSSFISDARRLPNGNTFINEGMNGRFFQITPAGEIVWEYVSPYFGPQPFGPAGKKVQSNVVYRAQPVPYDWTPPGARRGERAVSPPDLAMFRVPAER